MGLRRRLATAGPDSRRVVTAIGALTLMIGVSTAIALGWRLGWAEASQIATVSGLYAIGAGVGFALALAITALLLPNARPGWKIAATTILAIGLCLAATATLLILEHRIYYSQWHGPVLSRVWLWQQFFTALSATAQYGVMGVRYYGIATPIIVIAASWWAHRPSH